MRHTIIDVTNDNVEQTGFFCFMSKRKNPGWGAKREWLRQRFGEGLRIKLLELPERGFIEYLPGEYAWRPVRAKGYMVIHCLWVVGRSRGKGHAAALLNTCVDDARLAGMKGVAMVVSGGSYMSWKEFLERHGFEAVDTAPPHYELMALRFGAAPRPKFTGGWEQKARAHARGLTILRSSQCPYFADAADALLAAARGNGLPATEVELRTARDVRALAPSPYGTFSVVINGAVVPSHYDAGKALAQTRAPRKWKAR